MARVVVSSKPFSANSSKAARMMRLRRSTLFRSLMTAKRNHQTRLPHCNNGLAASERATTLLTGAETGVNLQKMNTFI
jgi:hypothetical protein